MSFMEKLAQEAPQKYSHGFRMLHKSTKVKLLTRRAKMIMFLNF